MYISFKRSQNILSREKLLSRLDATEYQYLYVGKIYPSGSFSAGRKPPTKDTGGLNKKVGVEWSQRTSRVITYTEGGQQVTLSEWVYFYNEETQTPSRGRLSPEEVQAYHLRQKEQSSSSPIDLTTVSYCRKKQRRGLKGLTKNGRVAIREGGYILTSKYGKRRLGFYTLTCPYRDNDLVHTFSSNLSLILKRYFERVKRLYARRGEDFDYVCGIEVQAKRQRTYGHVALHLHYVCNGRYSRRHQWVCTFDELKDIWHDCIYNVVGVRPDCKSAVDGTEVQYDAAAYVMKYVSKGRDDIESAESICPGVCPGRWYSLNNSLRLSIKKSTIRLAGEVGSDFWYFLFTHTDNKDLLYSCNHIYINEDGYFVPLLVGMSGRFNNNCKEELTKLWATS
jgi:hypothetical protein